LKAVALESCLGWKWNNRKRCRDLLNELRGREVGSHRVINIVSTRLGLDPALTCQAYGAFLVGRSGEFSQCTGSLSYIVESYELYAAAFHAVLRGGLGSFAVLCSLCSTASMALTSSLSAHYCCRILNEYTQSLMSGIHFRNWP
jgi:hypothetical protein